MNVRLFLFKLKTLNYQGKEQKFGIFVLYTVLFRLTKGQIKASLLEPGRKKT